MSQVAFPIRLPFARPAFDFVEFCSGFSLTDATSYVSLVPPPRYVLAVTNNFALSERLPAILSVDAKCLSVRRNLPSSLLSFRDGLLRAFNVD